MSSKSITPDSPVPLSIYFLLVSAFLVNTGQFTAISYLAVYLTTILHYSAIQVGTVLTINLLCARLLPLVFGIMGDRTSHTYTIILGAFSIGLGYLGYAFFHHILLLYGCATLTGAGTALYTPSIKSILSSQSSAWRIRIFTRFNQALNAGAIIGPLLGGLVMTKSPTLIFVCGGGILLLVALLLFTLRKHFWIPSSNMQVMDSLKEALKNRGFLMFTAIMILFYILFTQLTISFPLQAIRVSHQNTASGVIFIVNGLLGIIAIFLLGYYLRKYAPILCVGIGLLCVSLGLGLVPLFPSFLWLLLCVGIYTLGETLTLPASDTTIAQFSPQRRAGAFFGLFSLSWAIGGTIGNYLGTALMATGNPIWPWIIYSSIGFTASVLMFLLWRQKVLLP